MNPNKPNEENIVAIDISKDSLEVQFFQEFKSYPYTPEGISRFLKKLRKLEEPFVVFEATGGYEKTIKQALHDAKITCCLVNPERVRHFAASEGIKAKTDEIDAQVIWDFAKEKNLKPTPAPSQETLKLQALMDRRSQLTEMLTREKNRLHKAPEVVAGHIQTMINHAQSQLQEIEALIRTLVKNSARLKQAASVMESVQGVGEITSWTLLAYLDEVFYLKRNAIVALAGIAPFNKDSGKIQKPRRILGGRAKVRKCLYMAALTAARFNSVIKPYFNKLIARGKPAKCAIVACMRKLLIHIQSILQNQKKEVVS